MKRMVGIAMIAVLVLLALVGVACAQNVEVTNVTMPEKVYCDENFYYYATLDVKSDTLIKSITLTLTVSNQTKTYSAKPEDITPSIIFCTFPTHNYTGVGTYEVKFGPVNFYWDFDPQITKAQGVQYKVCCNPYLSSIPWCLIDIGPREVLILPPKVEWQLPPPQNFYYGDVLEAELFVDDKAPIHGHAYLSARNLSSNETKFDNIIESKIEDCGGNKYIHKWRLEQGKEAKKDYHNFMEGDKDFTFEICAIYNNAYHSDIPPKNRTRCANTTITEYIPKIVGGPYLNATADAFKFLGKNNKTEIDNIKWKDLDEGNFSFSVTIEDEIGKGNATLQVYRIKNNTITNYSLKSDEGEGFPYEYKYYNNSIQFDRNDAKANTTILLRLNYSRPNLPSEFWNEWPKVYNITIIPFEIDFKNATVKPEEGNWSDEFKYSVLVNVSKDLSIDLRVFDPCLEPWPWKPTRPKTYTKYGPKPLNWTIKGEEIFSENCTGQSKFYFKYEGGETPVFLGPYLGPILEPPEFNNGTPNPNVTIYCNWSKSSTPCNYSVNVATEDEYKVRLLVKDPVSNDWIPKGDVKDVSRETKNITWLKIVPFESLNMDNITQYIGNETCANFTFEYDGHSADKSFTGPVLVAAFKDPKIEPPEPEFGAKFNYSINVSAGKNLNVTLKYRIGKKWVNLSEQPYISPEGPVYDKWEPLEWQCIANETWEEARMKVEGEGINIEVK